MSSGHSFFAMNPGDYEYVYNTVEDFSIPGIADRTPNFRASYDAVDRTEYPTPNGFPAKEGLSSTSTLA
jgi:hypothetical protein